MTKQPDVFAAIAESLERIATAIEEVAKMLTMPTVTVEPAPFAVDDHVQNARKTRRGIVAEVFDTYALVSWESCLPWRNVTFSWEPFDALEKVLDSSPDQDTNISSV